MLKAVNWKRSAPERTPTGRGDLRAPRQQSLLLHKAQFAKKAPTTVVKAPPAPKPVQFGPPALKHRHNKRSPMAKLYSTKWKPVAPFNVRLHQALEASDDNAFIGTFQELDQQNIVFNLDTVHLLLKYGMNHKNEDIMDEAKALMSICNLRANETTYKMFIDYFTKTNNALALEDARHKLQDFQFARKHVPEILSAK